jgi:hypothetical protein
MTKMSSALTSVLLIMLVVLTGACSRSNKEQHQHAEEMVREWTGKAIQLPDSLSLINGDTYYAKDADFTILSYIDSAGCTACHLKLPLWKQYLPLVDSLSGTSVVRFLFVIQPKFNQDLKQIAERAQFQYPIHADTANAIALANRFPAELEYGTFLLDHNHRVLAVGNPVLNKSIKKVYLDIVGKREIDRSTARRDQSLDYSYDFGKIRPGAKAVHTFRLENTGTDTLRIEDILTSCECTEASVSSRHIEPGNRYDVTVSFQDTIKGKFFREVLLKYVGIEDEVSFEISGEVS